MVAGKNKAAAALLMKATKNAGALDVQVNVVWSVWEGLGRWWGQGRGRGEEGHKVTKGWGGALTHACFYSTERTSARRCIMQV